MPPLCQGDLPENWGLLPATMPDTIDRMTQSTIIVHGGAGPWLLKSKRMHLAIEACQAAAKAGQAALLSGASALTAVETAVRLLEDCPVLDAGRGSYLNQAGEIEMDALIMDGQTLDMGAVAAVQRVSYPISLARRVMTDSPYAFIVGAGAEAFADSIQFPRCTTADLLVDSSDADEVAGPLGDTVGAVARDQDGNLATATSTGGTRHKLPGRVGDSPLVGSGAYADNHTAAVSATGQGEAIMKILLSKQVCDYVAAGLPAQTACEKAIHLLTARTEGEGGLIAIDHLGRIGLAFNTRAMPYAYASGRGKIIYGR